MRAALEPLRIRPFDRIIACYAINLFGSTIGIVALALLVYDETEDPVATAALYACFEFLPAFLAPVLIARIDQLPARSTLAAISLLEGALFAALGVLAKHFSLALVLTLAVLDGALVLAARGILRAAISDILEPHDRLREGNALVNLTYAVASVLGLSFGGVLVGAFSASTALFIDAGSFVLVAVILMTASGMPTATVDEPERFWHRLTAGFTFAGTNALVRLLLVGESLAVLLFALVVPIEVVYAKEILQTSDAGYGLLLASWAGGAVAGSLIFARSRHRGMLLLVAISTGLIGAAYLGMGLVDTLAIAAGFSVLGGAGNGMQWVAVMTAVQEATPKDLQARIAGLLESLTSALMGAGFILGGVLASLLGPDDCFAIAGAATLSLIVFGLIVGRSAHTATPV